MVFGVWFHFYNQIMKPRKEVITEKKDTEEYVDEEGEGRGGGQKCHINVTALSHH